MKELSERDAEIFKILVVHWVNHNGEHVKDYAEWADKARTAHPEVAAAIDESIDCMRSAAGKLMEAKIHFQNS